MRLYTLTLIFALAFPAMAQWQIVPSPNPSPGNNELLDVALSGTDVWTVGSANVPGSPFARYPLLLHSNGTGFTAVSPPTYPSSQNYTWFNGVAASPSIVLCAGRLGNVAFLGDTTFVRRLNVATGTWSVETTPSPSPYYNNLADIAFVPGVPGAAYAVGHKWNLNYYEQNLVIYRSPSGVWTEIPVPNFAGTVALQPFTHNRLHAVTVLGQNNVWATGVVGNGNGGFNSFLPTVLHWNGTNWTIVPLLIPSNWTGGMGLGIDALPGGPVWVVGFTRIPYGGFGTGYLDREAIWEAVSGVMVPAGTNSLSTVPYTLLRAVKVFSMTSAYAVGQNSGNTLILAWNGGAWSQASSPSPGNANNELFGIAGASASSLLAVGRYKTYQGSTATPFKTLVMQSIAPVDAVE